MFLHVSVILFTGGGGIPACIAGGIPACFAGFQAHTWGEVDGSGQGQVSRPTPKGEVEGSGLGGASPGLHPRRKLRGLAWGVSKLTPRGSPGPHPVVSRPTPGGFVSQHALSQTPQWLLLRAVRILLECILVFLIIPWNLFRILRKQ